jgi:putative addiction module killer protein
MVTVIRSEQFQNWLNCLSDPRGKAKIKARIDRMALGNLGDCKSLKGGLSEARLDTGPGYRLYFTQQGSVLIVLLVGGDKSSQKKDIKRARELLVDWEKQHG